jgi:hypothetical protein
MSGSSRAARVGPTTSDNTEASWSPVASVDPTGVRKKDRNPD